MQGTALQPQAPRRTLPAIQVLGIEFEYDSSVFTEQEP